MLLSGCKGNTFFWKSTFFYGLICVQSEKTQKTTWFISQQTDLIEEQKQRKQAYFVAKRNRIVGFFTQNTLKGYKYWIFFKFLAFITGKLCIFASTNQVLRIWLNKQKETFLWVQRDVSFSFRRLQGRRIKLRCPPKVLTGTLHPIQPSLFSSWDFLWSSCHFLRWREPSCLWQRSFSLRF